MPALRNADFYVTPEAYLAAERVSDSKHEYLAGFVHAMAGAGRWHNLITGNIFRELGDQLRGKACIPFGSDMRLRIQRPGATFYYYPDVTVDCSGRDEDEVEEPSVIFEVLSPATERADTGDKLFNYQSLPSMRAYVLVNQSNPALTIYRRGGESDEWVMEFLATLDATLELPEIGCVLPLKVIYERVIPRP